MFCQSEPNIVEPVMSSRKLKEGEILRYKSGFLGSKWKKQHAVLFSDSRFFWFDSKADRKAKGSVLLKDVIPYICVGLMTDRMPVKRPSVPEGYSVHHLVGIGMDPRAETVHWILFSSDSDIESWFTEITKTLPKPPQQANQGPLPPGTANPQLGEYRPPDKYPDAPPPVMQPQYPQQPIPVGGGGGGAPPPYSNQGGGGGNGYGRPYQGGGGGGYGPPQGGGGYGGGGGPTTVIIRDGGGGGGYGGGYGGGGGGLLGGSGMGFGTGMLAGSLLGYGMGSMWGGHHFMYPSYGGGFGMGSGFGGGYGGGYGGGGYYSDNDTNITNNYYNSSGPDGVNNSNQDAIGGANEDTSVHDQTDTGGGHIGDAGEGNTDYYSGYDDGGAVGGAGYDAYDTGNDYGGGGDYGGDSFGGGDFGGGDFGGGDFGGGDFGGGDF